MKNITNKKYSTTISIGILFFILLNTGSVCSQEVEYNSQFTLVSEIYSGNIQFLKLNENKFAAAWKGNRSEIDLILLDSNGSIISDEISAVSHGEKFKMINLNSDKFVIAWRSGDDSGYGVFAQIYNHSGERIGEVIQVNTFWSSNQYFSDIKRLEDNRFIVTWESWEIDSSGRGCAAQILDGNGNKIGEQILVNEFADDMQYSPTVNLLPSERFIVYWTSASRIKPGIFSRVFDYDGNKAGKEEYIYVNPRYETIDVNLIRLSNGLLALCWHGYTDEYSFDIYMQLLDNEGRKINSAQRVNDYTAGNQYSPNLLQVSDSSFVINWTGKSEGVHNFAVYNKFYNLNGEALTEELLVDNYYYLYGQQPLLQKLNDDNFILVWQNKDLNKNGIFAQLFRNDGNKLGTVFRVKESSSSNLIPYNLVTLSNDKYLISYGRLAKVLPSNPHTQVLNGFSLESPVTDETVYTAKPVFRWSFPGDQHEIYPWEVTYDLYISDNIEFSSPIIINEIQNTVYQIDTLEAGKTYFWKVLAKNIGGDSLWSEETNGFFIAHGSTDINENDFLPDEFNLSQNYPNPFNPSTTIEYSIPELSNVRIDVFNVLGQKITILVNEQKQPGNYKVTFDAGATANGVSLSSGVYYYKLKTDNYSKINKMCFVK